MGIAVTIIVVVAAIAVALLIAPRRELVTQVDINASPARVWAVLSDTAGHSRWNPFLVKMEGRLEPGATLTNTMRPSAGKEMTFRPVVLAVEPQRELRWLGRFGIPRIFDGEHYFLLSERDGGTRLVHGERFRGIALWFMDVEQFRGDFERMNAALKREAETSG